MQNDKANPSANIFQLLVETTEKERQKRREELLAPLSIKQFFAKGKVTINKRICKGVECKLCIKACPTNALFWKAGEVAITEDLCIYCGACVLNCIVDDCIKVVRERADGKTESFSKPRDVVMLQHSINSKKRTQRVDTAFRKRYAVLTK
ncbi:MAG: 4Fe-4S dicluster domain-containing protein [Candidatus Bathyarchaeales archaeon]